METGDGPEWKDKSEEERQEAMAQFGLSINCLLYTSTAGSAPATL